MAPSLSLPLIRSIHRPCIRLARPEIGVEARIAPGTRPWASASGCLIPWPLGHILPCCRCHPSAIARCHRRGRGGPSHAPSYALAAHSHTRARARARARTHRMPLTTDHERSTGAPRLVGGCSVTSACAVARHSGATCGAGRTARVAEAAPARAEEEAPARACRRPRKCGRAGCQHAPCVLQPLHGVCAAQEAHSMACDTCWGGRGAEGVEGEGRARAPARRQRARAPPRARAARAAAPATSRAASGGGVGDRLRGVATEGARCAGARAAGTLRGQTSGNDFRQSLPFLIVLMTLPIYTALS